ncbi:hypothetical protein HX071_06825 [Myroides marinus]|uniref:hypothetical protein n=1 Tax=Myroides marinus TaxID=703342 RepID=UPI0025770415|nr:hypothetical protein [Myroides marinus]MDM1501913.1 hypothetical protein [Myroides marinus]
MRVQEWYAVMSEESTYFRQNVGVYGEIIKVIPETKDGIYFEIEFKDQSYKEKFNVLWNKHKWAQANAVEDEYTIPSEKVQLFMLQVHLYGKIVYQYPETCDGIGFEVEFTSIEKKNNCQEFVNKLIS